MPERTDKGRVEGVLSHERNGVGIKLVGDENWSYIPEGADRSDVMTAIALTAAATNAKLWYGTDRDGNVNRVSIDLS